MRRLRGSSGGPKRSESRMAMGRAPMVKMSRRIPPTPVAAPWYGSMKDGWLWDSILKTAARPSPMSTAPAFSPGPCTTREPVVGSVFRWMRLLLYEQCSDHITEKSPSSVRLGSRPSAFTMRPYSWPVRLCRARRSAVGIEAIILTGASLYPAPRFPTRIPRAASHAGQLRRPRHPRLHPPHPPGAAHHADPGEGLLPAL